MTSTFETISVIVPTYRRPVDLRRCLEAVRSQTVAPDEVLVIVREGDGESEEMVRAMSPSITALRRVSVPRPGQVAALNAGLEAAICDIVAITDDDGAPRPDWLARIREHFHRDPRIGGVGGRDWVHHANRLEEGSQLTVGRLQWFGRVIGNHHLGVGVSRPVDVLKGANMSYRRKAIGALRFEERLLGTGAQVHNDLDFSLSMRRAGWTLIYDPAVAVDHYPAQRFDDDQREEFDPGAQQNAAHNEMFALMRHLSWPQKVAFLAYAIVVGTWAAPGLLQWPRLVMRGDRNAVRRIATTLTGRLAGIRTYRSTRISS
jgi:cellulose synthase/poly-beta-1,6-N-acetylglucosamine synthase-like glycosyltransferase